MGEHDRESVVELEIPSLPGFLKVVRLLVSAYTSCWELPYDEVEYVKVAVSEACNNAIQCARGKKGEKIKIKCWLQKGRLGFEVKDKGKRAKKLSDEQKLGLILIKTLMEDVEVVSRPEKGTKVVMYKSLKPVVSTKHADKEKVKST